MSCYDVIVKNGDWQKLAFHGTSLDDAVFAADRIPRQNGNVYIVYIDGGEPAGYVTRGGVVINLSGGKPEPYCAADEPSPWDYVE